MTELKSLSVGSNYTFGPLVTKFGFKNIYKLEKLEYLNLHYYNNITDGSLWYVAKIKNLKELSLFGCNITNHALFRLIKAKKLESLNVNNTKVTYKGLKFIAKMNNLNYLTINGNTLGPYFDRFCKKYVPRLFIS